jgi:TolB-like protein/Tfp pilus assembly protein PilF
MQSAKPVRLRLSSLRPRLKLPYPSRWLRRVGSSFRLIRRRRHVLALHEARISSPLESPPETHLLSAPFSNPQRSLNKGPKQATLSGIFEADAVREARMTTWGVLSPGQSEHDLLEGWKAIADYLHKTERTVQRWEKTKGLPVHRFNASSPEETSRVFAFKSELDAWWQEVLTKPDSEPESEPVPVEPKPTPPPPSPKPHRPIALWIALSVAIAAFIALASWLMPTLIKKTGLGSPQKITLAVRPFRNLSADPAQDFVAAGLTEEMVTRLALLHPQEMWVVRLGPSYATATLDRLANELKADYVLEGSSREIGDHVGITAQLVQVANQTVVWGQSYDRDVKDLLRVQEEVAYAIAGEVLSKLPSKALSKDQGTEVGHSSDLRDVRPRRFLFAREVNREAYLAYLEGRYFWNKRTTDSLTRALALFQQSVKADPTYAPAYAGLADCYELLGSAPYTALPPNQAFPKAEAAARKALELDETLAEAHVSLGYSKLVYEWNLVDAEKELTRAIKLRPDYATGHQFYAYYLTAIGDLTGAIAERKRALELDPVNPLLTSALGEAFYQNRQFDLTIEQNSKSLTFDPTYAIALVNIGRAYELKGMHPQAREAFEKILAVAPNDPAVLSLIGHEYAVSGDTPKAAQIIAQLQQLSSHTYVPAIYIALVYTGLHDSDHAFEWLDKAYNEHCEYLVYLPTEPLADPLRADPRFAQLLQRLGLKSIKVAGSA